MKHFSADDLDLPDSVIALIQSIMKQLHSDIEVRQNEYKPETKEQKEAFGGTLTSLFAITMTAPDFLEDISALRSSDLPLPVADTREGELIVLLVKRKCKDIEVIVKPDGISFFTDKLEEAEIVEVYIDVINALRIHDPQVLEALLNATGVKVNE